MTNTGMFFRMLLSAVFRRRSRAVMAVVASLVGAATLSCLAMICIAVPQQMNRRASLWRQPDRDAARRFGERQVRHSMTRWSSTPRRW